MTLVAGELEAAQEQDRHEVAHCQAVGGRVEAIVEHDRPGGEALGEAVEVGDLVDQAAKFEIGYDVHHISFWYGHKKSPCNQGLVNAVEMIKRTHYPCL